MQYCLREIFSYATKNLRLHIELLLVHVLQYEASLVLHSYIYQRKGIRTIPTMLSLISRGVFLYCKLSKGSIVKSRQGRILLFLYTITIQNLFSCQILTLSLFYIWFKAFWPPQFPLKKIHFRKNYIDILKWIVNTWFQSVSKPSFRIVSLSMLWSLL